MNTLVVNAVRMKTTRQMLGMSREGLSEATDGRVSVRDITRLERGQPVRNDSGIVDSVSAALRIPAEFLTSLLEYDDYRDTASWRAVKKIPDYVARGLHERLTYFADKYRALEEYIERETLPRTDLPGAVLKLRAEYQPGAPLGADAVEHYAELMRHHICVTRERDFDCMERIAEVMESFGIKVACWPLPHGVSGLSMTYGDVGCDGVPTGAAVLVNRSHPVERRRFSLAHEWGHLILPQLGDWQADETACNRFAGALLMPAVDLRQDVCKALGGPINATRDAFQPELLELKAQYGVSISALLRRCYELDMVDTPELYRLICRLAGQRGWFRKEPEPHWPGDEAPQRYRALLYRLDDEDIERGIDSEWLDDVAFLEGG